ncbi:MAG: HAD-IC family P-type ATPase, partial [bacterium]|nr:HAD-IC family P-type ATPase [bacterium]
WHSFPLGDVFLRLNSKRDGLTTTEAEKRLQQFGENKLSPNDAKPFWHILFSQFLNPLIIILILSGGVTFYFDYKKDSLIIFSAVLLNSLIGFFQEYSAKKSLASLKKLEVQDALVLRESNFISLPASKIVLGDIIIVKAGDKISADARIINSFNAKTNESVLTGEAGDVLKSSSMLSASAVVFERTNVVFSGTVLTEGSLEGIVFGVGDNSEVGRIGKLLKNIKIARTPFEKKIYKLSQFIGLGVLLISLLIFIFAIFLGRDIKEMFLISVAIAVAAVPESLPVAVTVILAIGTRRILKAKGLIKKMVAVETLGYTSVILTDKTGTLTHGDLRVSKVLTPEKRGGILEMDSTPEYLPNRILSLSYGLLASEAIIENLEEEFSKWKIKGSAVAKALVEAAYKAGLDFKKLNKNFKKLGEINFNSQRKFSVSFRENEDGEVWAIIVGAADVLLSHIKRIQILNRYESISSFEISTIKDAIDALARNGFSVLAVCSKKIEDKKLLQSKNIEVLLKDVIFQLNLVGLLGLKDSIRPDVKDFIALSHKAGIRTVMVTGDHTATARLVAKEVGFFSKERKVPEVLEGKDINLINNKDFYHRIKDIDIFSRVTPEQKLKIVEAWQSQGGVVTAIGDGINDAPLLLKADVGVSLASGTDLAREASGMVLLENNFAVLIKAIKEGRVILENIKKVTAYLLSTSLIEIFLVSISLVLKLPLPITAIQILWVNLVSEVLPAIALSFEGAEKDIMNLKPQNIKKPILDNLARFLIFVIGVAGAGMLFGMFLFFGSSFESYAYAQSIVFAGLGVLSIFSALSLRSLRRPIWEVSFFSNKYLLASLGLSLLFLVGAIYLPFLNSILNLQPIGLLEWVVIFSAAAINIILVEISKWIFNKKRGNII